MKGQSVEARHWRLLQGLCPIHGIGLTQIGVSYSGGAMVPNGEQVACPRRGCLFKATAREGSKLYKALHGEFDPVVLEIELAHLSEKAKKDPTYRAKARLI